MPIASWNPLRPTAVDPLALAPAWCALSIGCRPGVEEPGGDGVGGPRPTTAAAVEHRSLR
ncbi:MAG: hypothetical protein AAF962_24955 [Actinomycetota bacterium]